MARILCAVVVVLSVAAGCISQPTLRRNTVSALVVDPQRLNDHVVMLSETCHPRDWEHVANLERCAGYITSHFTNAGAAVEAQVFDVRGQAYRNVIGRFGVGRGEKIVVGAHYDACADTPGADDNASGVAALIELAYLLQRNAPDREIELVAYTLEEPPFFRTQHMGSAVHARRLAKEDTDLKGVIVLEMVGCFSDEKGSQSYPSLLLKLMYPSRGNFIAVAGPWDQGDWIKAIKIGMKGTTDLPVYSIRAPSVVPGIDFSDHLNYWPHGFKAIMITDTAFYRNRAYHTPADTADSLDYNRMAKVVVALYEALRTL
jgi:Zn-dependent M28 family amino/carboxypeptidase